MLITGLCAALVTGLAGAWGYAPLAGWDCAALVFTGWVWLAIGSMGSSATASRSTREDPGRAGADLIVLIAAVASLGAVGLVLIGQRGAPIAGRDRARLAVVVGSDTARRPWHHHVRGQPGHLGQKVLDFRCAHQQRLESSKDSIGGDSHLICTHRCSVHASRPNRRTCRLVENRGRSCLERHSSNSRRQY
ncbi:DUF1345 domain-containing protein [Kribbella alba]|uniref:DUF1345 domain-containing protein n=1 Tax=Kribbella alba TaxID=190197 RepID=UPI003CD09644